MYKLLFVDDEILVRKAISNQMNWAEYGFECIGVSEDGIEALEFIERNRPDVVLTDIDMPFMDGLELTKELSERYPLIKVIILTGYDDFEYAQQAIKMQAVDYILKPVTPEDLGGVLGKLRSELDVTRRERQDYEHLKRQLTENMPLLRERFLERMLTSQMSDKEKREGWQYFQTNWKGSHVIELVMAVDDFLWSQTVTTSDQQLIWFAVFNVTQEIMSKCSGAVVFRDRDNRVLTLVSGVDPVELQEEAMRNAEEIHHAVTSILPVKVSIGIGDASELGSNVSFAHETALSALEYRFAIGSNSIIRLSDMAQRSNREAFPIMSWESELITKLKTGTMEEMEIWVAKLFAVFRDQLYPGDICQIYLQRIVLTLMHTLYEMNSDLAQLPQNAESLTQKVTKFTTLYDTEEWMKSLCTEAVSKIKSSRENFNLLQIAKSIEYFKAQFNNPELSIKSVCNHITMSTSYFSTLFKQYTGKTFIEYVTHERMEKAKELLNLTSMKSYEIAYQVGYSDPHYFSGAFKKHAGDTPTDYRLKMTTKKA
ncbi:response regulator transcription factor [Cohnella mopanensis]|uniref:response regulator transcription factor n=1 Tax=Cohnella mopanensis TaxID=2911966 RepID=UPI001EF9762D|nr:response regulator [Cohnella mopanensis]